MTHNDITGDSIANTKGSAEKYARGWERLFGTKAEEVRMDAMEKWLRDGCYTVTAFDGGVQVPITSSAKGNSTSFVFPSAVMALDFHDSQPVKVPAKFDFSYSTEEALWDNGWSRTVPPITYYPGNVLVGKVVGDSVEWEEAEQAREDAGREAVMWKKDITDEVKWIRDLSEERVALVKSIHK